MNPHYGLTHVALAVQDVRRSLEFYHRVLGLEPVYEKKDFIQAQTPGTHDVLVFEHNPERAGRPGGIVHFGFRLVDPAAITGIIDKVADAGGTILDQGDFAPGMPYVFFADPDGHEVEVWFEAATAFDPR